MRMISNLQPSLDSKPACGLGSGTTGQSSKAITDKHSRAQLRIRAVVDAILPVVSTYKQVLENPTLEGRL